jgi:hypothetical protein
VESVTCLRKQARDPLEINLLVRSQGLTRSDAVEGFLSASDIESNPQRLRAFLESPI